MKDTEERRQRVVIVGAWLKEMKYPDHSLEELEDLVEAADGLVVGAMSQRLNQYHPATLIGRGKVHELKDFVKKNDVDLIIFDQELSGIQMRNIEDKTDCAVLDRTGLILDIFAKRAKTREGKLQVYLAQLNYQLTHLIGMRNLSRLGGGIGTRGPGEQKLETDRRHIRRQIDKVKEELREVKKHRELNRHQRDQSQLPLVSLVGYTNAGKSSLMNRMLVEGDGLGQQVFVKDMLFASLDSSLRKIRLPGEMDILVSDTVGFVSNLPTTLVEAFNSTLEEVTHADVIIHVLDGSREDIQLQYDTTWEILRELKVLHIPILVVVNKMDLVEGGPVPLMTHDEKVIHLSVQKDEDLSKFYEVLGDLLTEDHIQTELFFNFNQQDIFNLMMNRYEPNELEYRNDGIYVNVLLSAEDYRRFKDYEV